MNDSANAKRRRNCHKRWGKGKPQPKRVALDIPKKVSLDVISSTYSVQGYYEILVGNYGVKLLCKVVCDALFMHNEVFSDSDDDDDDSPYIQKGPSVDLLTELMLICHLVRCYRVSIQLGYYHNFDQRINELYTLINNLKLPSILCKYIEAIGCFQLKNGITVVPWFAPMEEFYASDLEQLIPAGVMENTKWLHEDSISDVISKLYSIKTSKPWLQLRRIDWDNTNGSNEISISAISENSYITGISPQECSEVEAQRGALYNFRRFSEQSAWPAQTVRVCQDLFRTEKNFVGASKLDKINSTNDTSETIGPTLYKDYRILTGNYGIENLCRFVHNRIKLDYDFGNRQPSFDQLVYIMIICHIVRCYTLDRCNMDKEIIRLKECLLNIQLPSILCKYIEAIGKIQLKNGLTVIPWFGRKAEFYSSDLGQLTPEMVLRRAGRSIPENDNWCIDYEWIYDFCGSKVHMMRSLLPWLQLRNINWDNKIGSTEMLISRVKQDSEDTTVPTCPEKCSELEAQRGALFNYRQFTERSAWPADTSEVCQDYFRAGRFIPATVLESYSTN